MIVDEPGAKILVMGNEAMTRAAIEMGIGYSSTYPGTPASEIGDTLAVLAKDIPNFYFEYSMNEAAAIEGAAGASWIGIRSLCTMKHVGLNVASDPLHTIAQSGTSKTGGLVIICASDPGVYSSQSEQDDRWFAYHLNIPILEPSNVLEAYEYLKKAFEISEQYDVPILFYPSSRVCHSVGKIQLGDIQPAKARGEFKPAISRFVNASVISIQNKKNLIKKIKKIRKKMDEIGINRILEGTSTTGIITSGSSFGYTLEALDLLGIHNIPILKLGIIYPLAEEEIVKFVQDHKLEKLIIVEELLGFLENEIKEVLFDAGIKIELHGKDTFADASELNVDDVQTGLAKILNIDLGDRFKTIMKKASKARSQIPSREPTFCPGCPHRGTFYAMKKATGDVGVFGGDIGCNTLGVRSPFALVDWVVCMGAGVGIAQGISHKSDQSIYAFIGDGTFYHSGMTGVLNAIYNDANMLLIIMENHWVGMTGHQPTPSTGLSSTLEPIMPVQIKDIIKAFGCKWIRTVDPYKTLQLVATIKEAMKRTGFRVIISDQECSIQSDRRFRRLLREKKGKIARTFYYIDPERCQNCKECLQKLACPAIILKEENGEENIYIEEPRCTHCGVCYEICPNAGIIKTEVNVHLG
ncbi:MAG: thiamine pyrophosphate-dependent enzyme [Promethearchaeota archaeon]